MPYDILDPRGPMGPWSGYIGLGGNPQPPAAAPIRTTRKKFPGLYGIADGPLSALTAVDVNGQPVVETQAEDPNIPPILSPEEKQGILNQFQGGPYGSPAGGPQLPAGPLSAQPQEAPGFFQRLQSRPDAGAINDGLIQAGIGVLSGKNPQEGLAQGLSGFNTGYEAKKASDKAEKTPKIIPLQDGAFTMLVYPDGTQKVVKNGEVAQYVNDQNTAKAIVDIAKARAAAEETRKTNEHNVTFKNAEEARAALQTTDSGLSTYEQAAKVLNDQGIWSQVQGIPGVKSVAEFFGTDASAGNQFLNNLKVDNSLLMTARSKGAISDAEMKLFAETSPSLSADREKVWKPWVQQRLDALKKVQAWQQSEVSRGNPGAASAAPTAAPAPAAGKYGGQAVPGLSANAQKYFH